ncbi:MAG: hypothetical protein QXX64_06720 [Nitrososphaera sp.]
MALAVVAAALASSLQAADAIVSVKSAGLHHHHQDYQDSLLVAFFTIVCSALLVTMVIHYYRIQWGRKSIITE